jgi:hypothetical protein
MSIISGGGAVVGAGGAAGGYEIERSLRFNSADSAYLNRTPASAGNRKTWTWSGWVKISGLDSTRPLFAAYIGSGSTDNQFFSLFFDGGTLRTSGYSTAYLATTAVYRDPSAWYHIVCSVDTTSATANNRIRLYVNGVEVTVFSTRNNPSQNADLGINQAAQHEIGQNGGFGSYFSGYMTEINFIDGQALTPTDFGEFNSDTGVWQPIDYTGTYGTNGFYLPFSDNASTTTLGDDFSGNGNDWTTNNFSVTAGAGNDSLVDSPTRYGTDTGAGGEVRGNYCTLNPLVIGANLTLSNGGLTLVKASTNTNPTCAGTFGMASGKWYFELTVAAVSGGVTGIMVGVTKSDNSIIPADRFLDNTSGWGYFSYNGTKQTNSVDTAYGNSWTTNDVIGVAVDADAGKIWFSKNGTFQASGNPAAGTNEAFSGLSGILLPAVSGAGSSNSYTVDMNFGQRPFAYTAPSGFKALVTTNLPTPTIEDGGEYFNTVLYTGTGSSLGVTGVGFQPDWVWIKERSGAADHGLYDVLRGVQNQLESNTTTAETAEANGLTAFGTDGFTVGSLAQLNTSADTYVAWNWKANGAGVSNTAGTITSTVSVNTTSGFSIVTYTGTGANATVGHGLGVAPSMVICKRRNGTGAWVIGFTFSGFTWSTDYFQFDTAAKRSDGAGTVFTGAPTSTTIAVGTDANTNGGSSTLVAYCFAPVAGYSAFGSYTGNGNADGPFVYTGFRPRYVLLKVSSTTGDWQIFDTARNTYNIMNLRLDANANDAESTAANLDTVSNGFKLRTASAAVNGSGATIIYACFAENPFSIALAR